MSRSRLGLIVAAVALVLVACAGGGPAGDASQAPGFVAQPTPTSLATEPPTIASTKPKATAKPQVTATPKSGSYYKPPGWDGYSDVNCSDFDTHAHAQSFFKGTGGTTSNDPYGLDGDHDGKACETLP